MSDKSNPVVSDLKANTLNPEVWESICVWDETAETGMCERATATWNFDHYDVITMSQPVTARLVDVDGWVVGHHVTVQHEYFDAKDAVLGTLQSTAFLPWNSDGKIIGVREASELLEFKPVHSVQ